MANGKWQMAEFCNTVKLEKEGPVTIRDPLSNLLVWYAYPYLCTNNLL